MNKHISIRHISACKTARGTPSREDQEGMALILALLMGLTMMTGVSALFARQLISRQLSAKESYQQMAEGAANNGFNRILAELNNPNPDQNRGFLFTLDNRENINEPNNGFTWELINSNSRPLFSELCVDTSIGLPQHPENQTSSVWPTTLVPLTQKNSRSMREDGLSQIETFYRLRGYSSPGTSGGNDSGEAKFIVEGIVKRKGADPNTYLARSRLERSLYIQNWVDITQPQDWAILAAAYFELGPIQLNSAGLILWHTDLNQASAIENECNTSRIIKRLGQSSITASELSSRIWPVIDTKQPPTSLFENEGIKDLYPGQQSTIRAWRINDNQLNPPGNCQDNVICHRPINEKFYQEPSKIELNTSLQKKGKKLTATTTIRLKEQDICEGKTGDCHVYVDEINIERSKLLIENESRPVVIHLLGSSSTQGQLKSKHLPSGVISLGEHSLICGVDKEGSDCNNKPERLVITTESKESPERCNSTDHHLIMNGNSLPAALVLMRKGTVSLANDAGLNGIIWTDSYCSNNHQLTFKGDKSGRSLSKILKGASELWRWNDKGFAGYGRNTTRGIRGTSLDQFQRF